MSEKNGSVDGANAKKLGQSGPRVTDHTCHFGIENWSSVDITGLILSHNLGQWSSSADSNNWLNIPAGSSTSADLLVNFQTGFGADSDWWAVMFIWYNNFAFADTNKMCNLTSADKDGTGWIRIQGDNVNNLTVTVVPPSSSNCDAPVAKAPSG